MYPVKHEPNGVNGVFYMENDGKRLAGIMYNRSSETVITLDHTLVDASLRGTGAGESLIKAAVEWAREQGFKIIPMCPYANSVFMKNKSLQDVLHLQK